jgi:hypothetical protein
MKEQSELSGHNNLESRTHGAGFYSTEAGPIFE